MPRKRAAALYPKPCLNNRIDCVRSLMKFFLITHPYIRKKDWKLFVSSPTIRVQSTWGNPLFLCQSMVLLVNPIFPNWLIRIVACYQNCGQKEEWNLDKKQSRLWTKRRMAQTSIQILLDIFNQLRCFWAFLERWEFFEGVRDHELTHEVDEFLHDS